MRKIAVIVLFAVVFISLAESISFAFGEPSTVASDWRREIYRPGPDGEYEKITETKTTIEPSTSGAVKGATAGGAGGATVGGMIGGPVGAAVGGAIGAIAGGIAGWIFGPAD